jgi:hypothetical protein
MFANALLNAVILLSPTASAAQADLAIEALWVSEADEVTVSVVVSNQGNLGAQNISVDLYGSKGGLWESNSPNSHYSEEIFKLKAGEYIVLEFVMLAEEWGNPEDGVVFVAVDVLDSVSESDEGDNFAALAMLQDEGQGLELGCSGSNWVPANLLVASDMNQAFLDQHPSFPICKAHGLLP